MSAKCTVKLSSLHVANSAYTVVSKFQKIYRKGRENGKPQYPCSLTVHFADIFCCASYIDMVLEALFMNGLKVTCLTGVNLFM